MNRILRHLLIPVFWVFLSDMAFAEFPVIVIGEQPPLFSSAGGLLDQTIALALEAEGVDARFEWLPVGRILSLLEQDALDVYVTPSNTAGQQNPHLHLLEARGVFFYMKDVYPDFTMTALEDLAGKRVATVDNSPLTPIFENAGIIVDEGPLESLFQKLALGRVDFATTADVGGLVAIRQQFPGREDEFDFSEFSYASISAGLYVKDLPEYSGVLETLQHGMATIKADGSLDELLIDFFGPETWKRVRVIE